MAYFAVRAAGKGRLDDTAEDVVFAIGRGARQRIERVLRLHSGALLLEALEFLDMLSHAVGARARIDRPGAGILFNLVGIWCTHRLFGGTKGLSREHTVLVSRSGLVTVTGGKWTTYRAMAEDVLSQCAQKSLIASSQGGVTVHLKLTGADDTDRVSHSICRPPGLHSYGNEQALVMSLPGAQNQLCEGLSEAMVRFAARYEYAITVEDMLARRSRLLFLDARLASTLAVRVGAILLQETGLDPQVEAFAELAQHYRMAFFFFVAYLLVRIAKCASPSPAPS